MKLLMPNILKPALGLPLDIPVTIEVDEVENEYLAKELMKNGWIIDN